MADNYTLDAKVAFGALPSKEKCCSPQKKCALQKSVLPKMLAKKVFSQSAPYKSVRPKMVNALFKLLWSQKCALPPKMCSPLLVFTFPLIKCPLQSASSSDKCSPWSTLLPKSAILPKKCSPLVLSSQKVPFSKCSLLKKRILQSALASKCALFKVLSLKFSSHVF